MYSCRFCEETYVGVLTTQNWCETCRKLKNLGNVYGFTKIYEICERVCIRQQHQINNKIKIEIEDKVITRSSVNNKKGLNVLNQ